MSLWSELRNGIRQAILLEDRVDRPIVDVAKLNDRIIEHDRRLTRVEAFIAFGLERRLPPKQD
jgi:hypothetical protein